MNSLEVSHDKGFSLIELLLSSSLIMIIGVFMFPLSITFYRTQLLNETREGMQSVLVRAQDFSRTSKGEGVHGVKIEDDSYVLFEGISYADRDPEKDEVYVFPATIEVAPAEVVFERFTGTPSDALTIQLQVENLQAFVDVSAEGVITTY